MIFPIATTTVIYRIDRLLSTEVEYEKLRLFGKREDHRFLRFFNLDNLQNRLLRYAEFCTKFI